MERRINMDEEILKVYTWQKLFGKLLHLVSDEPTIVSEECAEQRVSFLYEEIDEYIDANKNGNLVEVLDALCDILYFLLGMVVIHGFQKYFTSAFNIVHDSNMSKLDKNGNVLFRKDGKILKGDGYWKPTEKLKKLLNI
jgi:predicted HAD superfamily Cof-like phosphohydrolase